jgi:1-pyrroline-5-carboxylate dehydrogenase
MSLGTFEVPIPENELVLDYRRGSTEWVALKSELTRQASIEVEIPLRIGGRQVRSGRTGTVVMPHDYRHVLATFHHTGAKEVAAAIDAARAARDTWGQLPFDERASVFLKAATLLTGRHRERMNAATMLGQSKTVHQSEIDAVAELADFFRFNVRYLAEIMEQQPRSAAGSWNRMEYRPLDGFVFAVTPFNFTSIGGNLPTAPAICGNTVLWKPATQALLGAHYLMDLLEDAGLPPGVINMLPGEGAAVGDPVLASEELGGVHFTGSTATFRHIWRTVGERIDQYRQYPRMVGETGGKDFVFVHESADEEPVVANLIRGAYEYQGQKCSAASRAYVPSTLWPSMREALASEIETIRVGDVQDFRNFMGAVIDATAFDKIASAIDEARANLGGSVEEVVGGAYDRETGWFIRPTIIVANDPQYRTMCDEIFGPVLSIYVYDPARYEETLQLCDATSPYGLTGSIFATDRSAIALATDSLRHAAGNFYVNDKPTGATVGQQPFGGSRASGTNDKAGSPLNLGRWLSPRAIKETFDPARDYRYPFMEADDD